VNAHATSGIYSECDLSIQGSGRLNVKGGNGIYGKSGIELRDANVSATGDSIACGIYAKGDLKIENSSVDAEGPLYGLYGDTIEISGADSAVKAQASTEGRAAVGKNGIILNDGLGVVTPSGGRIDAGKILGWDGKAAREAVISRLALYDVWVGEAQATSANCADVLGNGQVSYNPDARTLYFTANTPPFPAATATP